MVGIKYYHLAKDEKPPDEFCAVRDMGGEPGEYMFYVPEAENAKLSELARDMGELLDALTECDMACKHYHDGCIGDCYYVNARRELGIEVDA